MIESARAVTRESFLTMTMRRNARHASQENGVQLLERSTQPLAHHALQENGVQRLEPRTRLSVQFALPGRTHLSPGRYGAVPALRASM